MNCRQFLAINIARSHPANAQRILDRILICALLLAATIVAIRFFAQTRIDPQFYQGEFAPAIALACGDAATANPEARAAIERFLAKQTDRISCDQVPVNISHWPRDGFQTAHRYLLSTVGTLWRATGIDWNSIRYLSVLMFAITAGLAYRIFRVGVGPAIALCVTLLLIDSPLQLDNLPHLRDYSKAPFLFAVISLLALIVTKPMTNRQLVIASSVAGLITGIGVGFRMDLLILAPIFPLTCLLFLFGGPLHNWPIKFVASLAFLLTLAFSAWPILTSIGNGGNSFHVVLLGLMSPFDGALGISSSIYEWGYRYNDIYVWNTINSFAHRTMGISESLQLATTGYDHAGATYYLEILKNFPADIYSRFLAALISILKLAPVPDSWPLELMPLFCTATILLITFRVPRHGLFLAGLTIYFAAMPALQFHERHYFHMQIFSTWLLAVPVQSFLDRLVPWLAREPAPQQMQPERPAFSALRFAPLLGYPIAAAAMIAGPLLALREWQQNHLTGYISNYDTLRVRETPLTVSEITDGTALLTPFKETSLGSRSSNMAFPVYTHYWVAEFDGMTCGQKSIDFGLRYAARDPYFDGSRKLTIPLSLEGTKYIFPTFDDFSGREARSRFLGIELPADAIPCLAHFGEVADISKLRLLPNLRLEGNWQEARLYQRLRMELPANSSNGARTNFHYSNDLITRAMARIALSNLKPFSPSDLSSFPGKYQQLPTGVRFITPSSEDKPIMLRQGAAATISPRMLVAHGTLAAGTLELGFVADGAWTDSITIAAPGEFTVALVPKGSSGSPAIALTDGAKSKCCQLDMYRMGIVSTPPLNLAFAPLTRLAPKDFAPILQVRLDERRDVAEIEGDSSQYGYQVKSRPVIVQPHARYLVRANYQVLSGKVCLGVLDESEARWIVAPAATSEELSFSSADSRSVKIVFANCNSGASDNQASRFFVRGVGLYAIDQLDESAH